MKNKGLYTARHPADESAVKPHRILCWCLLLALVSAALPAWGATDFKAGVASIDITPPRGWRLAGEFNERISTNTLSPLHARAMVFQQGRERAAVVICDLLDIDSQMAQQARLRASQRCDIPYGNILIAATRTPNGPLYHGAWRQHLHEPAAARDGRDLQEGVDFSSILAEQIADLICQANRAVQPARLGAGQADCSALLEGQDESNSSVNGDLALLLVLTETRSVAIGCLASAPVPAGAFTGRSLSAGHPHVLEEALRKTFGPGFLPLFAVSAESRIDLFKTPPSVNEEAEFLGASLGQIILGTVPTLTAVKPALAVRSSRVPAPPSSSQGDRVLAAREKLPRVGTGTLTPSEETDIWRILEQHQRVRSDAMLEVQVVKLGADTALVGLPAGLPTDLAAALKRGSPFKNTLVIGHCQETFATSSEAGSSGTALPSAVADLLVRTAADLLNKLK